MHEKYRYINVDFPDWRRPVENAFKEKMNEIGVCVYTIHFKRNKTCFEGYVLNWRKFLTHLGYTDEMLIIHATSNFFFRICCKKYEASLPFPKSIEDKDFEEAYSPYKAGDFHTTIIMAALLQYNPDNLYKHFVNFFTDCMRELHNDLKMALRRSQCKQNNLNS